MPRLSDLEKVWPEGFAFFRERVPAPIRALLVILAVLVPLAGTGIALLAPALGRSFVGAALDWMVTVHCVPTLSLLLIALGFLVFGLALGRWFWRPLTTRGTLLFLRAWPDLCVEMETLADVLERCSKKSGKGLAWRAVQEQNTKVAEKIEAIRHLFHQADSIGLCPASCELDWKQVKKNHPEIDAEFPGPFSFVMQSSTLASVSSAALRDVIQVSNRISKRLGVR